MEQLRTSALRVTTAACILLVLAPSLAAGDKEILRLARATEAYRGLVSSPGHTVPESLLGDVVCIAIFPRLVKAAFVIGGRHGKGVVSCRREGGSWSPPLFIKISGGSWGLQVGAQSARAMLMFMTDDGAESLKKSGVTLGAQASVAAGPVGRSAEAGAGGTDIAEIYTYAKAKGLFVGLSFEGAQIAPHWKANQMFYRVALTPEEILFDNAVTEVPKAAAKFMAVLP